MHVADEFFLSLLPSSKFIKDFAETYDNWEYIENEIKKINKKIENYILNLKMKKLIIIKIKLIIKLMIIKV